jgi:hypothetical protein
MPKRIFTEEHCRRLSISKMGDKNPSKRPEVREKLRIARLGKPSWCRGLTKETDERLRLISEKQKGRIVSEETKNKIRNNKERSKKISIA